MIYYDELKYIIERLPVPSGLRAGHHLQLVSWQDRILRDCFGSSHRYEIIYVEIPRKNGKTTFVAGLLLALFCIDPEPGAEFYCASGDKEQAGIIFRIASSMRANTPAIEKRIHVIPSLKMFVSRNDPTRIFKSLSADAYSKHGYNPYFTVFDEFHIFKSRELWDVLDTGDVARDKPMKMIITTAGTDTSTLCGEFHDHAMDILQGRVLDPTFKPYVYTVEDKSRWRDEDQWRIANPSIEAGLLNIDRMRAKYTRAVGKPSAEANFKRLHLNIWAESEHAWVDIDYLQACAVEHLDDAKLSGGVGGLDLGFGRDATSFSIYNASTKAFRTWVWVTEDESRRIESLYGVPWSQWIRSGYVATYGRDMADYDIVERDILGLVSKYGLRVVAYDRWKAHQLITKLARRCETVPVGQGFASMTMPVKHVEGLVQAKKLVWYYNPCVLDAFKRIYIKQDAAGNVKPDKSKSWHKIDPVVALLNAVAVAESRPAAKPSVYEKRGIL